MKSFKKKLMERKQMSSNLHHVSTLMKRSASNNVSSDDILIFKINSRHIAIKGSSRHCFIFETAPGLEIKQPEEMRLIECPRCQNKFL